LREYALLIVLGVAGCSSSAKPATKQKTAADVAPEANILNRTWIVDKHIMVKGSSVDIADAKGFHGRTVEITAQGFASPWQGDCASASRSLERRDLPAIIEELGIKPSDEPVLTKFGFTELVSEFRLQCTDREKAPPFLIYLSNDKAMTCYGGACYLLILF